MSTSHRHELAKAQMQRSILRLALVDLERELQHPNVQHSKLLRMIRFALDKTEYEPKV